MVICVYWDIALDGFDLGCIPYGVLRIEVRFSCDCGW